MAQRTSLKKKNNFLWSSSPFQIKERLFRMWWPCSFSFLASRLWVEPLRFMKGRRIRNYFEGCGWLSEADEEEALGAEGRRWLDGCFQSAAMSRFTSKENKLQITEKNEWSQKKEQSHLLGFADKTLQNFLSRAQSSKVNLPMIWLLRKTATVAGKIPKGRQGTSVCDWWTALSNSIKFTFAFRQTFNTRSATKTEALYYDGRQ